MNENKDRNLIYQYVFHNYDNEFHLLSELKRMMKDYYSEILSGEYFFDYEKFDTFSDGDLILKDIIPPIIKSDTLFLPVDFLSYGSSEAIRKASI